MKPNDLVVDVQNTPDERNLSVNRVGICRLQHPLIFEDITHGQLHSHALIGTFDMFVNLAKNLKGTHMSRFVELLNEQTVILSVANLNHWAKTIAARLHATHSHIKVHFPFFIEKMAPVTKVKGLLNYEVTLEGFYQKGVALTQVTLVIPVTSLCPCSKEISAFGAHNQRSHITVTLQIKAPISIKDTIQLVESKASSELFSILKRADEKAVTEKAYQNPKFVEDMVRDIATSFNTMPIVAGYKISSENFESIHNHSAFAEIDKLKSLSELMPHKTLQSEASLEEVI